MTINIEVDFSLDTIWQAYQRDRFSNAESSLTSASWTNGVPLGLNRNDPSVSSKNGAGIDQSNYIGQYTDDSTSLDYLNARYYNSTYGQFLSEDPVFWAKQQALSNPQSLNSYSYANSNPVSNKDPDGKTINHGPVDPY